VIARHHDGERVVVTVAPCSPFSVTPELMRASAELARRHGLRLHTHLAETEDEERDVLERFGRRPVDLLDELGWIGGDVWVAHGIHFDDAEVTRLGAAGTGVAHCPSSNARLGAGMCRVVDLEGACTRPGSAPATPTSSCRTTPCDWRPRAGRDASAGTTSDGSSPGSTPTS
jgi:cytosine/adenosine deaminase-related metal-dependent hydrolase